MAEANQTRVYQAGDETTLTASLLDLLRYDEDLELCFGAFNALVYFISQNFVFAQTIKQVSILGTAGQRTGEYFSARRDVSEFRRLRKWLHQKQQCTECIAIVQKIIDTWCQTTDGQNLLRDLNLEEYIVRILRMRIKVGESKDEFKKLLHKCLDLVTGFCQSNLANQNGFAKHMTSIILVFLQDPEFYTDAAEMLGAVVQENKQVSVSYSGMLVQIVGDLSRSPDHGRSHTLLGLLETLLVVDNKPVEASQVKVCKGAFINRDLIETQGDLDENEWCRGDETGPAMSRYDVMREAALGSDEPKENQTLTFERCMKAAKYYSKCLELLGICSRGNMPATEMLCASILSYEECIKRLNELYQLEKEVGKSAFLSAMKAELLTFFLNVFVDTTSSHILLSVRRSKNGLWSLMDGSDEDSVATHIMAEMKERVAEVEAGHTTWQDAGTGLSRQADEEGTVHLFEEAVLFYIHYAGCVGPGEGLAPEERYIIKDSYEVANTLAVKAQQLKGWSQKEEKLIQQLKVVARGFLDNKEELLQTDVVMANLATTVSTAQVGHELEENEVAWQRFVEAAVSTIPVMNVRGTDRLVGKGLMTLAKSIWMHPPGDDGSAGRYAAFLVKPLRERLHLLKRDVLLGTRDDIPKVLTVLDTVRAIPYSTTAYSAAKLESMFVEFVEVTDLDCSVNPYLAAVQKEMVSQGWALLCFEMLASEELEDLHLTALRLLLAMTGGGNLDAQNDICSQVTDMETCPQEIMAAAFRKLLRNCVADLKSARKQAILTAANKDANKAGTRGVGQDEALVVLPVFGHAVETLTLLSNCCRGNHKTTECRTTSMSNPVTTSARHHC